MAPRSGWGPESLRDRPGHRGGRGRAHRAGRGAHRVPPRKVGGGPGRPVHHGGPHLRRTGRRRGVAVMTDPSAPIKDISELRRLRVTAPIRSPGIGTALVLEPAVGEPLVILPGERVPDPRTGNYRRSFLIDMARYGLKLDVELPSRDPSFAFNATV